MFTFVFVVCLFCFLFYFFLEKTKPQGNLYDKLSVSGWQGKRERPGTWEANQIKSGFQIRRNNPQGHVWVLMRGLVALARVSNAWSAHQTPVVSESCPHSGNLPQTNSDLTERQDNIVP